MPAELGILTSSTVEYQTCIENARAFPHDFPHPATPAGTLRIRQADKTLRKNATDWRSLSQFFSQEWIGEQDNGRASGLRSKNFAFSSCKFQKDLFIKPLSEFIANRPLLGQG
ncbi:MAG: hypothetical protein ACYTBJ_20940 [Planctomycetota bacterium]|jgi:hypothetical protein